MKKILTLLFTTISLTVIAQTNIVYDIVFSGGRAIDPETKLDAIKNVGILNNRIAQILTE